MDRSSSKKRTNSSGRCRSSNSSSDDDNDKTKRRLKENKQEILTETSGKSFAHATSHGERDRGECSGSKIKKSGKGVNLKRKRKYSSSELSSLSTSESERDRKRSKKHKKKERKRRKEKKRKKDKRKKREKKRMGKEDESSVETPVGGEDVLSGPMPQVQIPQSQAPAEEMQFKRRAMVPMTKEEYEKQQSKVRRVFDPETGRNRLVKGDGEIIEDIVSYHRHREINKLATLGDGASFQKSLGMHK